ncbi:MAG: XdhC family protein, partial [Cyclobacteriaceae bacterium]
ACALVTTLDDGSCANTLFTFDGKETVGAPLNLWVEVEEAYEQRANKVIEKGGVSYFIHLFPRKPILLVIGAAHITADLVAMANDFGFETVVIDPRGFFTNNTVFQSPPSQILTDYPSEVLDRFPMDNYTYCAILSHDPKVDDNAIEYLLKTEVGYIGALGSRKRHERRRKKLIEQGYSVETVDRIHGPIGEPIHSITAKEIALAIMSQIVKVKNQYQREFLKAR